MKIKTMKKKKRNGENKNKEEGKKLERSNEESNERKQ